MWIGTIIFQFHLFQKMVNNDKPNHSSFKVDINFNITTNVNKELKEVSADAVVVPVKNLQKPTRLQWKDSPRPCYDVNVIKEEESKHEQDLNDESDEKLSVQSVSSSSESSSDSEYNFNQTSIPKIKISNYDEQNKKPAGRISSNKLNFDPKNLIKGNKAKLEDLYEFCGKLGKGSYGEVIKLKLITTGEFRACKTFLKSRYKEDKISVIRNELKILKMMDHPHIVKVYDYYENDDSFNIVMEYWKGGELFERISKQGAFSEDMASNIMKQILSAISYLHSQNIVHSDLKAENIMFFRDDEEDLHWKLIDFGMASKYNPEKKMSHIQGTPYYIAPEVLKNWYDSKADIWSLGVLLYIMLSGSPPFRATTLKEIFK